MGSESSTILRADTLAFFQSTVAGSGRITVWPGTLFCAKCCADRTHHVQPNYLQTYLNPGSPVTRTQVLAASGVATCLQCHHVSIVTVYKSGSGEKSSLLGQLDGGLGTPATPPKVKYFLEQASRAGRAGAYSAALTMYASALESILIDAGYDKGTLGSKIAAVQEDLTNGELKDSLRRVPAEFLTVLNEIGKDGRHADRVEIGELQKHDHSLFDKAELIMSSILEEVYERDQRLKDAVEGLRTYKDTGEVPT